MMKTNRQKKDWLIDMILFSAFLLTFFMDLTGLELHQWLGIGVGALALYHLWVHRAWVVCAVERLLKGKPGWMHLLGLIDTALVSGFALIILSGIVMSTWLALRLEHYHIWRNFHIIVSIATLLLTVIKIGLHWRWIACVTRRIFGSHGQSAPAGAPAMAAAPGSKNRREFLGIMGVVGAASLIAIGSALSSHLEAEAGEGNLASTDLMPQPAADDIPNGTADTRSAVQPTPESSSPEANNAAPSPAPTQTALVDEPPAAIQMPQPEPVAENCVVNCRRGCSYPGRCRRYRDNNGNNLCDLGECL